MAKKKNLRNQLRRELYRQRKDGDGRSRHADKQPNKGKPIYDKIYSDLSLKTHLSRIEQFSKWAKVEHPGIKNLNQITRDIAGEYLQQQVANGKSPYTVSADMLAINRVMMGSSNWDKAIQKSEYSLPKRSFGALQNNHGKAYRTPEQQQRDEKMRDRYREVLTYGQAFGLRRSELVPSDSRQTVSGTNSLYERDNKLYHVTTGKGGRLRAIECLRTHEQAIRDTYGQYIKSMPDYLTKESYTKQDTQRFRENWRQGERFFDSLSRSLRIHVECRQYYAMHKLEEIQRDELFSRGQERSLTINGVSLSQSEADYISHQLGHGKERWDVLNRYIGR
ncbi:hypothetical protein [Pseudogracilibacillus auburnensis]|uniref:hypothetical protein n=1 Tax=Pseudogracilibacillus auburnensis TaxID=1494959 RepID=UPI001A95B733|nr:hypothetical protein [Pseudogracilibacillus auburnensis]MBO1005904.1 hypothetical protein [Pseudogracilibacillus auburnensis]